MINKNNIDGLKSPEARTKSLNPHNRLPVAMEWMFEEDLEWNYFADSFSSWLPHALPQRFRSYFKRRERINTSKSD